MEADQLAEELANDYVSYLFVDTRQQRSQVDESIEELLTNLEEICSVLENYRSKTTDMEAIPAMIASKRAPLEELYNQIDRLEQYICDTDKMLDHLETRIKDYESQKRSDANPILQVIKSIWSSD